ncbi:MAG: CpaF family protein [Gemmatimonadaceae bacterium]|nr:CpaF family protein [Gemmatimonadaceae bacterium]
MATLDSRPRTIVPRRSELEALGPIEQLKVDLHRRLVEQLDLEALENLKDTALVTAQIRDAVAEFLRTEGTPLTHGEREDVIEQIVYEVTGLGPIEPFFRDMTISDILVNGPRDVYIERYGRLTRVPIAFRNDAHLRAIIDRIVSRVGRRVDESSPMVDARLPDGSRVNAIIPPLAIDGPILSIRRFGADMTMASLVDIGSLTQEMVDFLTACVQSRLNIMISGGTGSGKTTLLNALSAYIPSTENTGHEGSLTTIHANSPRDALARVETMIQFASTSLPLRAIREQIASSLELVVQIARMADGTRRIVSISEIAGMEGDVITMQELFRFRRQGITQSGEVVGSFEATGVRPLAIERLHIAGVDLPDDLFVPE